MKNQSRNVECYNCHEIGHISTECPMERKSKKKTLVATWDDSSEFESDSDKSDQAETKSYTVLMARALCDSSVKNIEKPDDEAKSGSKSKGETSGDENEDEDP